MNYYANAEKDMLMAADIVSEFVIKRKNLVIKIKFHPISRKY